MRRWLDERAPTSLEKFGFIVGITGMILSFALAGAALALGIVEFWKFEPVLVILPLALFFVGITVHMFGWDKRIQKEKEEIAKYHSP